MQKMAETLLKMEYRIGDKLRSMDATSIDKAVTIEEVGLDIEELNWLNCVAGGMFASVKKTRDKRYYITT